MTDSEMPPTEQPNPAPVPPSVATIDDPFKVKSLAADTQRKMGRKIGRRTRSVDTPVGVVVRSAIPHEPLKRMGDIALIPTLQAAAQRSAVNGDWSVINSDLRRKVRSARTPNLVLFVVDASGSMAARQRMQAVKGAILSLLLDAYQKRDNVGLIAFRGTGAQVLLPPTNSVSLAQKQLAELPTGGRTPLADGLRLAHSVLYRQMRRDDAPLPLLVLLSDGRANVARGGDPLQAALQSAEAIGLRRWSSLVIDCESGYPKLGLAQRFGKALRGEVLKLEAVSAETITRAVQNKLVQQEAV